MALDPAVEAQALKWRAALIAGNRDVQTQVFGLAQAASADQQELRRLVREAQKVRFCSTIPSFQK